MIRGFRYVGGDIEDIDTEQPLMPQRGNKYALCGKDIAYLLEKSITYRNRVISCTGQKETAFVDDADGNRYPFYSYLAYGYGGAWDAIGKMRYLFGSSSPYVFSVLPPLGVHWNNYRLKSSDFIEYIEPEYSMTLLQENVSRAFANLEKISFLGISPIFYPRWYEVINESDPTETSASRCYYGKDEMWGGTNYSRCIYARGVKEDECLGKYEFDSEVSGIVRKILEFRVQGYWYDVDRVTHNIDKTFYEDASSFLTCDLHGITDIVFDKNKIEEYVLKAGGKVEFSGELEEGQSRRCVYTIDSFDILFVITV